MIIPIDQYRSLACVDGQPYSFSESDYAGKLADLGPRIYSPLYRGQPIDGEARMFAPEVWGIVEAVNTSDYSLIISGWDTASRTKETNDPSDNCIVGRRWSGDFVVLDNWEGKFTFDKLLPIVLERYRLLTVQFVRVPVFLCIEEADSGKALCDVISSQFPMLPLIKAHAVKGKIIRAESVTPFTSAGSVKLLRGPWNTQFITDWSNFPASGRDHSVDAGVHCLRVFTGTGADFDKPLALPANTTEQQDQTEEIMADLTYREEVSIDPGMDDFDGRVSGRRGW
jgi:predicted phage terminase large subunit-like protein